MHAISIGHLQIGPAHPPLIVAEVSANHLHSLNRALQIVDSAKACGAHAVKLQTYTADTMTLDIHKGEFVITAKDSLWRGKSLYELYQEAYTPWEWHEPIFQRCRELGLLCFSSPFDASSVDFLETLNPPCYKIASLEIIDLPLIRRAAATGKPLIISTGGATEQEIAKAVSAARQAGCKDLVLLKCTCAYPASPQDANLRTLPDMAEKFKTLVGLSDHTLGIGVALASIALGACLIEKHFTLSRNDGGPDSAFSLEPSELHSLSLESMLAWQALGHIKYGPTQSEMTSLSLRRSLYFVRDLSAGETLTENDIQAIRPGRGLPPDELENLIGRQLSTNVKRGDPVRWDAIRQMKK